MPSSPSNDGSQSAGGRRDHRPVKKRRRLVVSCTECHRRKQKCDRDLPCANCRSRNKQDSCTYETGAPTVREKHGTTSKLPANHSLKSNDSARLNPNSLSSMAASWGYGQTGVTTIGFLRKIEASDPDKDNPLSGEFREPDEMSSFTLKEKYKGLIRQLPTKPFLDKLIDIYMTSFNHQYYIVDPSMFTNTLAEWRNIPFGVISASGPHALNPDLRVFPAMLFQMVATALLVLPEDGSETEFDSLKYAADMMWEDLAKDYSESAMAIVRLFGKKGLSITGVEAQFLRAVFSKYVANVTESWHMLAETIRDAQELGMHAEALDPKPEDDSLASVLENQWMIQRRRKLYMCMVGWDVNTCLLLGRPSIINADEKLPPLPLDVSVPRDIRSTPLIPRDDDREPPTPIVNGMWLYRLSSNLREVLKLDSDGPFPKDWTKVDALHQSILSLHERQPAIYRIVNPDTRWDELPETQWIKGTRYYMAQIHQFTIMCLHRRYMFYRRESREETLRASLTILKLHKGYFENVPSISWKNHTLFFGTFDALVQTAAIYILFPRDHPELRELARQHFDWTIERLTIISERNALARSAQGVLKAIQAKFTKALSSVDPSELPTAAAATSAGFGASSNGQPSSTTPELLSSNGASNDSSSMGSSAPPSMSQLGDGGSSGTGSVYPPPPSSGNTPGVTMAGADWTASTPATFGDYDFTQTNIAPLMPISDLLFNDLMAENRADGMMNLPDTISGAGEDLWQFGGEVGDDTLWRILNQF